MKKKKRNPSIIVRVFFITFVLTVPDLLPLRTVIGSYFNTPEMLITDWSSSRAHFLRFFYYICSP